VSADINNAANDHLTFALVSGFGAFLRLARTDFDCESWAVPAIFKSPLDAEAAIYIRATEDGEADDYLKELLQRNCDSKRAAEGLDHLKALCERLELAQPVFTFTGDMYTVVFSGQGCFN
jgi:hypothetical protein